MHFPVYSRPLFFAAAVLLLILPFAAACGGDGGGAQSLDDKSVSQAPGAAPASAAPAETSDGSYMKSVCSAANDVVGPVIDKVAKDPSLLTDQKKLMDALTPVLADLSGRLAKIQPPTDLKQYHAGLLERFGRLVDEAKAGQLTSVVDIANVADDLAPPEDAQERLARAARDIEECQQSLLFGAGVFGG